MNLPILDPLWGPNGTRTVEDRSQIRVYLDLPASNDAMVYLTTQMNSIASVDPPSVVQIQAWLDEISSLEQTQVDEIEDGTAHFGNASSYEGLAPGKTLTRDDKLSQAGKLSWNTDLDKVRYEFGSNPRSTAQGQRDERLEKLVMRIATALNMRSSKQGAGTLIRG